MTKRRTAAGLANWIEANIELPHGLSAEPGPVKLWPWQPEIAHALLIDREPASILVLMPTEADCRDFVVTNIEGTFDGSPALQGRLSTPKRGSDRINRNTLCHRLFNGGSLKVVAGKAPRNLCRYTARILLIDEADAIECRPRAIR
jgi:hypothetical protein